jgi:hypothetical protein
LIPRKNASVAVLRPLFRQKSVRKPDKAKWVLFRLICGTKIRMDPIDKKPWVKPDPALVTRTEGGKFAVGHAALSPPPRNPKPKGVPRGLQTIAQYLRDNVPPEQVARFLIATMENPAAKLSDRLCAARMILERRDGAVQVNLKIDSGPATVTPDLSKLSDAQLATLESTLLDAAGVSIDSDDQSSAEPGTNDQGALDV